jgi:hypothetical protein
MTGKEVTKMADTIYTARMDERGTYFVYADGVLLAEKVPRTNALLFEPALPELVTVRLPALGPVQARVVHDEQPLLRAYGAI